MLKILVGKRIKSLRVEKGLSQEDLAFKSGLDRTYITYVETAKKNVTIETLYKITKALDISLSDFFDFDESDIEIKQRIKSNLSIKDLKQYEYYSNLDLSAIFECSTQGGMRVSRKNKTVTLISQRSGRINPYDDSLIQKDGTFVYTGMGLKGDQVVKPTNQNGKVAYSLTNGYKIYYFIATEKNKYQYIGEVKLNGEPYFIEELDIEGNIRQVIKFPLILIS